MSTCQRSLAAAVWFFFFFNDTATTEIYTLSLHDALPICRRTRDRGVSRTRQGPRGRLMLAVHGVDRSEEHTSELQSQSNLVCRLLLEKKKRHRTGVLAGAHCAYLRVRADRALRTLPSCSY